jgi:thymidylate synthase (FAD)
MPATNLNVRLLAFTPDSAPLVVAAMRQCYSGGYAADLYDAAVNELALDIPEARQRMYDFIERVLASGHESPIEHINFTFAVSGISRALSHQLVRHRIASYSQQSQRYVDANGFMFLMPPNIAAIPEAVTLFKATMDVLNNSYLALQEMLRQNGHEKTANEDARFVLPNACETRIVFTMNTRTLWNFFGLRCCDRAQWEIREMAVWMLRLCREAAPILFKHIGAKCIRTGYCNEGPERTCGKRPMLPKPIKILTDEDLAQAGKDWP